MRKIILAPDSFKGTMSSLQICEIMENVIRSYYRDAEIIKIPVADGGEGTADSFLHAASGEKVEIKVSGPHFETVGVFYTLLPDKKTAVIEMAQAAGLPLVGDNLDPSTATTYGVGQMIRLSVENGCNRIILGLGGSATNDGGAGMAAALGVRFFDKNGTEFIPVGATLCDVKRIDLSECKTFLKNINVTAMCDIKNPLCGKNGASAIYGPQKGADDEMVHRLDDNLKHFAGIIKNDCNIDVFDLAGGGAAGGMGSGAVAFLNAELKSGIDTILDTVKFDTMLENTDLVLTGEGKIDGQSSQGKVVCGIAQHAKQKGVPVVAVVGDIGDGSELLYNLGVTAIMSINRLAIPFEKAKLRSETDLSATIDTLMRIISIKD